MQGDASPRRPFCGLHCVLAAAGALLCLTATRSVRANGRFPESSQLVFSPHDPGLLVARTTFGLLVSRDHGGTWQWVCESAIGLGNAQEDPCFGVTQTDAIVGALWQGLSVSPDTGCNWAFAGGLLAGQHMVDLVVRPDSPGVVLGLTGTWLSDAGFVDSRAAYYSQVFESTDDAAQFAPLGLAIDASVVVTTLEVAKSDPHRLYISGTRGTGATRTASLFVSADDGKTWAERPIPFLPNAESGVYIGGVDPADSDVVYVRTDGNSRLLVTTDAGLTFQVAAFVGADGGSSLALSGYMLGFALSPDGSKVYAGGIWDGLFVATRGTLRFVHRSDVHVQCLAAHGGELWACSDEASGFVVGASTDDGATFVPRLHLAGLDGVLACGTGATTTQCESQYPALCQRLDGCKEDDGGPAYGPGDAGPPPDAADATSPGGAADAAPAATGGCSVRVGGGGPAGVAAIIAGILVIRRWRRRE